MSKNMTRKGLALGTATAIVVSGFASLPANANGIANDFVVLIDKQEYENYNMLSTGYIEIDGSFAAAAQLGAGAELKFRVQDPNAISVFDVVPEDASDTMGSVEEFGDSGSGVEIDSATAATISGAGTTEATITFPIDGTSGIENGDVITIADLAGTSNGTTALTDAQKALINGTHQAIVSGTGSSQTIAIKVNDSGNVLSALTAETITEITITETTSSAAMDTVAELRIASFGAAGVVGNASARSTVAATLNNYVVDTDEENATAGNQTVRFASASDSTTGSITVTGWVDNDNDNVIDTTEYVSDPLTITFVAPSSVTYTISAGDLFIGTGTSIEARVTANLNLAEVGAQSLLTVDSVLIDASAGAEDASSQGAQTLGYDTVNEWLDAAITVDQTIAAGDSVRFQVKSGTSNVGAAQTFGVGSLTVAGSQVSVSATTNNTAVLTRDTDGASMSGATVKVRKGTATVSGVYTAFDGNPTDTTADKVVSNVPYTMSVTSSAVTAADGVKLNGKVVDGGTETILGFTDGNGQIAISLTQTAADASDTVTVTIDVQGQSSSGVVTFAYEDTNYEVYDAFGEISTSADYNGTMAIGGTFTRDYIVADQFGIAPANGTAVITATRSGTRTDTAATWAYQLPVVDGKVRLTITDNGKGTGSDTVTVTVYPLAAGGGLDSSDDTTAFTLTYATAVTDVTPAAVTATVNHDGVDDSATNDKPIALEPDTLVAHDARATGGKNAPSYETNNVDSDGNATVDAQLTLSGTVTNASGGLVPGALVTIKGTGVGFKFTTAGSKVVYGVGEITVRANAAGAYSVDVYGATGGSKSLSVTAGAATASRSVVFVAGGAIKDFTITTPANSAPGKTADVIVTARDASGNPVEAASVVLSSTGPGYLINTTGSTLADGTFSTKLLLGANDTGSAVIRVTMTIAGVATTKTATIVVGSGAAAGTGKVNVGSFNGKLVVYAAGLSGKRISWKVGGNWGSQVASSNYAIFNRPTPRAGVTVSVDIYVDGVKTLTKSVVTR